MFQCFGLVNNGIPPFQVMMGVSMRQAGHS